MNDDIGNEMTQEYYDSVVDQANRLLESLPNDESRKAFLSELNVCLLCGSKILPCYCAPAYDE